MEPIIEVLFTHLKAKTLKEYLETAYFEILNLIEKDSFLGHYARLKREGTTEVADWVEYVQQYPYTNLGVEELLGEPDDEERHAQIPIEVLMDYLSRNLMRKPGSIDLSKPWELAASLIVRSDGWQDSPLAPILLAVEDEEVELEHEPQYEAGQAFEQAGELQKALNCYENAVNIFNAEMEEPYIEALEAIFSLAPKFNNDDYTQYVESFREESDALDE